MRPNVIGDAPVRARQLSIFSINSITNDSNYACVPYMFLLVIFLESRIKFPRSMRQELQRGRCT